MTTAEAVAPAEATTRPQVAVVCSQPVYAEGFAALLGRRSAGALPTTDHRLDVVLRTSSTESVLAACAKEIDVVVIIATGLSLAPLLELITTLRTTGRAVPCVCVLANDDTRAELLQDVGASVVLTTDHGTQSLLRAVTLARMGRGPAMYGLRDRSRAPAGRPNARSLTARELDVLQGMADGMASAGIADELGVSINTVRTHVQRLLPKLGVHTRLRATAVALEEGLIERRPISRLTSRPAPSSAIA